MPCIRYRFGQWRNRQRRFGTRRPPSRAKTHDAVVYAHQSLRRAFARRSRPHRLDRRPQRTTAQLDWQIEGFKRTFWSQRQRAANRSLYHPPRYYFWRELHGVGTWAPIRQSNLHGWSKGGDRGLQTTSCTQDWTRSPSRCQKYFGCVYRCVCTASVHRPRNSNLDWRLRAGILWHGRRDGRTLRWSARLRLRQVFQLTDSIYFCRPRPLWGGLHRKRRHHCQLWLFERPRDQSGNGKSNCSNWAKGHRSGQNQLPPARCRIFASALLGRAIPGLLPRWLTATRRRCAIACYTARRRCLFTNRRRRTTISQSGQSGVVLPARRAHGIQHHARLGRKLLVFSALHGSAQPRCLRRSWKIGLLESGRFIYWRFWACNRPLTLCPLLDQSTLRPRFSSIRRTFCQTDQPRHDLRQIGNCLYGPWSKNVFPRHVACR